MPAKKSTRKNPNTKSIYIYDKNLKAFEQSRGKIGEFINYCIETHLEHWLKVKEGK